jgi:hypothetical protein
VKPTASVFSLNETLQVIKNRHGIRLYTKQEVSELNKRSASPVATGSPKLQAPGELYAKTLLDKGCINHAY